MTAAALLLQIGSAPAGGALPPPVADPAALPSGSTAPPERMRQNGECVRSAASPRLDFALAHLPSQMMNLPEAWRSSRGAGQRVAVIDTGVMPQPRLPRLEGGGDLVTGGDGLTDCDYHGTVVAGIIGAAQGEDGFAGIAPDAEIISIRQTSSRYSPADPSRLPGADDPSTARTAGDVQTLSQAVRHAADLGAGVINISVDLCYPVVKEIDQAALGAALRYAAVDKDAVVVAAAGNSGEDGCQGNPLGSGGSETRGWGTVSTVSTPSVWQPYVLSVGSVTAIGQPSGFTMSGPWVGAAAPGEGVVSLGNNPAAPGLVDSIPTDRDPFAPINGTSFAAPIVAGEAALVRAKFPELSAHQVINRIVSTSHNAERAPSDLIGHGVVDIVAALTWDMPDGDREPVKAPVVRARPPAPPPPDRAGERRAVYAAVGAFSGAALLAAGVAAWRRRSR